VTQNLIFGVTDTPSANRKAWRLLMVKFPRMYWGGCMSHEISLYMGDIAKMECSKRLADKCHKLYKWIMLHTVGDVSLLSLFQEKVHAHFLAKFNASSDAKVRRACKACMAMLLYKKGDTRMLSIFKLLFRTLYLMEPLVAVFSDARYSAMAQKATRPTIARPPMKRKSKSAAAQVSCLTRCLTHSVVPIGQFGMRSRHGSKRIWPLSISIASLTPMTLLCTWCIIVLH